MTEESLKQASGARDVFISYASQDVAIANSVVESLEQHGIGCWIAPRDVTPGSQYADEIVGAINDAKVLVLVLSQHAVASSHVGREIERAASKRRRIIALRTDAAALTRALEYFLSESQWIDVPALGLPVALRKLVETVGQTSTKALGAGGLIPAAGPLPSNRSLGVKQAVGVAALVVSLVVGLGVAIHFWQAKHADAQGPAAAVISDKSQYCRLLI